VVAMLKRAPVPEKAPREALWVVVSTHPRELEHQSIAVDDPKHFVLSAMHFIARAEQSHGAGRESWAHGGQAIRPCWDNLDCSFAIELQDLIRHLNICQRKYSAGQGGVKEAKMWAQIHEALFLESKCISC
jgi:hypothetical protein